MFIKALIAQVEDYSHNYLKVLPKGVNRYALQVDELRHAISYFYIGLIGLPSFCHPCPVIRRLVIEAEAMRSALKNLQGTSGQEL